jgi:hypothetical protein
MKKIALASVLKPPDDVRMYEKLGKTLSERYEVHLLGLRTTNLTQDESVNFHPIFQKKKKWMRVFASITFLKKIRTLKPDFLIICAVELLPVAFFYCLFTSCKLMYDVQENYVYNVLYQDVYKKPFKYFLAAGIRLMEWGSRAMVKQYFLAEKTYQEEFSFTKGKHIILENKAVIPSYLNADNQIIIKNKIPKLIVYSGTISKVYGALDALNFVLKWRELDKEICLLFIGRFGEVEVAEKIQKYVSEYPENFRLIGGNEWVSHLQILETLKKADLAILPYQPNRSTKNCIPTKLYECLAMGVPMLIRQNSLWEEVCLPYQAAIFTQFNDYEVKEVINKYEKMHFYPNGIAKMALWENEKVKLLKVFENHRL